MIQINRFIVLLCLFGLEATHSINDDAVYAIGVPFDIDGVVQQLPLDLHTPINCFKVKLPNFLSRIEKDSEASETSLATPETSLAKSDASLAKSDNSFLSIS